MGTGGQQELTRGILELTSMPLVTELWLLPDIDQRSVQADRSTYRGSASVFSPSPLGKDRCGPVALTPDSPFSGERLGSAEGRRGSLGAKGEKDCMASKRFSLLQA